MASEARFASGCCPAVQNSLGRHPIQDLIGILQLFQGIHLILSNEDTLFGRAATGTIPTVSLVRLCGRPHSLLTRLVLWHSVEKFLSC